MRLQPEENLAPFPAQSDASPRRALGISGFAAGTSVFTEGGWLPVEQVTQGDRLMTFDKGPQRVTSVRSRTFGANIRTFWPNGLVYVPDGALGPAEAFYLLPGQQVMLRDDLAKSMFDDRALLIPSAALVGIRGITRVMPIDLVEVVELRFDEEAIIECEGGTWLKCPGAAARVQSTPLRRRITSRDIGVA